MPAGLFINLHHTVVGYMTVVLYVQLLKHTSCDISSSNILLESQHFYHETYSHKKIRTLLSVRYELRCDSLVIIRLSVRENE
jgi:hypothetical protein